MESPFEGRLVRLRAYEPEDEPLLYQWFNDPEVTRHLMLRYPLSHYTEHAFIERMREPGHGSANFAVVVRESGELIGGTGLDTSHPENREGTLGISIGNKRFWDQGYGTDAMRTICRFGFEQMNLHRIQLEVYASNQRARKVYERVGFRVEGVRRQAIYKYGAYDDIVIMGLLEGELDPAEEA